MRLQFDLLRLVIEELFAVIMTVLKEKTAALHAQAERALQFGAAMASLPAYQAKLTQFYGFYRPLETKLHEVAGLDSVGFETAARLKWPRVAHDLRALGWSAADVDRLPLCTSLPKVQDLASALGCSYVLEGATLGGRIIAREVHSRLGLTPDHGCAFFSGYGETETGPMWRKFATTTTQFASANSASESAIVDAAVETFERFIAWMASGPGMSPTVIANGDREATAD